MKKLTLSLVCITALNKYPYKATARWKMMERIYTAHKVSDPL
jgi:hypothetical protein